MSGTSADGIDAAIVRFSFGPARRHRGPAGQTAQASPAFRLLAFKTYPWPRAVRSAMPGPDSSAEEVSRHDILLGEFFADAIRRLARSAGIRLSSLDVIGSHGQTISHTPLPRRTAGRPVRSTLQIGHPSVIARRTGVTTVGDFRVADVAAGGTGAPLVPIFDRDFFSSRRSARGLLNIGGIANLTLLPRAGDRSAPVAFDTGPGNMIMDWIASEHAGAPFDRGGRMASGGSIIPLLLRRFMSHPYLRRKPPKSTGREEFGAAYVERTLRGFLHLPVEDLLATAAEFTAASIYSGYLRHSPKRFRIDRLIVSGGGVHNAHLMSCLRRYFSGVEILTGDEAGCPSDAKEAICFAYLACLTILGLPGNLPSATGARAAVPLGLIARP